MKEFEKWFLKGGANINKHKAAEQNAWQAALEWIEHIVVHENNGPSNPKSLIQCIEEELNT